MYWFQVRLGSTVPALLEVKSGILDSGLLIFFLKVFVLSLDWEHLLPGRPAGCPLCAQFKIQTRAIGSLSSPLCLGSCTGPGDEICVWF